MQITGMRFGAYLNMTNVIQTSMDQKPVISTSSKTSYVVNGIEAPHKLNARLCVLRLQDKARLRKEFTRLAVVTGDQPNFRLLPLKDQFLNIVS